MDQQRPTQIPFDLGHRTTFGREDFWVSDSNREAVTWVDKWPHWPAPALVIYGPPASGRTHLLNVWRLASKAVALEQSGGAGAVYVDDIENYIGKKDREEKIFHVFNALKETGGSLLITAKTPPRDWALVLPDLHSRLIASPAVEILPPDDQLMAVMLAKLFSDRQIFVAQDVLQFIIPRVERSCLALQKMAAAIDAKALAEKRAVTIPLVRDLLDKQ